MNEQPDPLSQLQIIYVENDENDREIFKTIFNKLIPSVKINFFKDGQDFINFIFKKENYRDRVPLKGQWVIFLDIQMPKLNGLEVLKIIHHTNQDTRRQRPLPIFLLSTSSRKQDISEGKRLGALDYIVKPFSYKELIHTFSQILTDHIASGDIQEIEI